jgi:FkbM family methyltransferase
MKRFSKKSNLIIDLGMNNGDDTDYYLKTGARVVAVDANPAICEFARNRFETHIQSGSLVILNVAIDENDECVKKPFFINLDNDHWSSLDIGWATREHSRVREVAVDCMSIAKLFADFGVPKYLKVDVEGADEMVLDQLRYLGEIPFYLSVEDCRFGYRYMDKMSALGYNGFKLLDQSEVAGLTDTNLNYLFKKSSSGPFGEGVPGEWLSYADMNLLYSCTVRDHQGNRLAPRTHWWDIHCRGSIDLD